MQKTIALRIDVDTYRGTGCGVPKLCDILSRYNVAGTFYLSVGPDNMGRHLWRLLKPKFLWKMLRTQAVGLYGPEIVLMGTAWPGPNIGKHHAEIIKSIVNGGHEVGFHAWDHYRVQAKLNVMSETEMYSEISTGIETLKKILGMEIFTSAAPGWRTNNQLLKVKEKFPFKYNSDCRGYSPFYPIVDGEKLTQLQIPVTLPTYDEAVGHNGITNSNYNDYQLSLLKADTPNVLTIHAEAEGGCCALMFEKYLQAVQRQGYKIITLGELASIHTNAPDGKCKLASFPGREGELAIQE